jgi:hypothetical protein
MFASGGKVVPGGKAEEWWLTLLRVTEGIEYVSKSIAGATRQGQES